MSQRHCALRTEEAPWIYLYANTREKIKATLACFDRMLFRGYLPIQSGWAMAQFLNQKTIRFRDRNF
jgi:hypothetical protein